MNNSGDTPYTIDSKLEKILFSPPLSGYLLKQYYKSGKLSITIDFIQGRLSCNLLTSIKLQEM